MCLCWKLLSRDQKRNAVTRHMQLLYIMGTPSDNLQAGLSTADLLPLLFIIYCSCELRILFKCWPTFMSDHSEFTTLRFYIACLRMHHIYSLNHHMKAFAHNVAENTQKLLLCMTILCLNKSYYDEHENILVYKFILSLDIYLAIAMMVKMT